jgi:branched-chain amino acid transport system ATP-binding protein
MLETRGLTAFYGDFQALFGIDMRVAAGETVAIIGANGAGKTTFLKSITGLLDNAPDAILLDGRPIGRLRPHLGASLGIAMVPEGRRLFPSLTVEENLKIGAHSGRPGGWTLERIYALFPILAERRAVPATALSGGQQQMAAIGRALMGNPRLLLCDEISLGLAPIVVNGIYEAFGTIRGEGTTLLLVEQDIGRALGVADRVYCFQEGRVSLEGPPAALTRDRIAAAYFGI